MTVSPPTSDDPDATHEAAATVRDLVLIKHPASPAGYGWMVVDAGSGAGYRRLGWGVIELAPIVAAAERTDKLEEALTREVEIQDAMAAKYPDNDNHGYAASVLRPLAALASVVRDG